MSEILTAALTQNPIEFKAKFDEALRAVVLAKGEELRLSLVEKFTKDEEKDKKDTEKSDDSKKGHGNGEEETGDNGQKEPKAPKDGDDGEDEGDADADDSKDLKERTLSFEVGNPSTASKQLRSKGIAAASEPGDGKVVKVKVASPADGAKVAAWLADQGWSDKDIKSKYPELARLSSQKG